MFKRLPLFNLLKKVFPKKDSALPKDCLGHINKCAIRMSHALHNAGMDIEDFVDKSGHGPGICGKNEFKHAIRAEQLRNYLKEKIGPPKTIKDDSQAKRELKGRQGIIFFKDIDHIDLYDKDRTVGSWTNTPRLFESGLHKSEQIEFWDMTPPTYTYNPPNKCVQPEPSGEYYYEPPEPPPNFGP